MTETTPEQHFAEFRARARAEALGAVFDALAPQLLLVAAHLAGGGSAEDLVQATFVDAIRHRQRWDERLPLAPWLCGILANHVRLELRRRRRHGVPDATRLPPREVPDPSDAAAAAELAETVRQAVAALPRQYHQVLTLRFVHGLELQQIAHSLRLPIGTVKTRLYRGMALVKRALPAGLATAFAAMATPGRGLAAVREVVLGHAGAAAGAAATTMGAVVGMTGSTLGAIAMQKLVLVVGVVMLGAGGWVVIAAMGKEPAAAAAAAMPAESPPPGDMPMRPTPDRVAVVPTKQVDTSPKSSAAHPDLPQIYEVGALLRSPVPEVIEQLPLTDSVRAFLATPTGLLVAEQETSQARRQLNDLHHYHADVALSTARRLWNEGGGRRSEPTEAEKDDYSRVWGSVGGGLWIGREDAPELFAIKFAIRDLPRHLAASIARRVAEPAPLPPVPNGPPSRAAAITVQPVSSFYFGVLASGESIETRIRLDAGRQTCWEYLRPEWVWETDPPAGVQCDLQVSLLSPASAEVVVTVRSTPACASGALQGRVMLRLPDAAFRRDLRGYGYARGLH